MKILAISLPIILLLANSCKKTNSNPQMNTTAPLLYQVFDKNGNNIFTSQINSKDSVMLTGNNGPFYDQLEEPSDSSADTSLLKTYNGVIVSDNRIARYNNPGGTGANLQNTFTLSYHGQSLGVINFQLKQQHPLWVEAAVFTLNNIPAKLDSTTGIHIYKLQLQ